jgi:uncharacterized membrane protein
MAVKKSTVVFAVSVAITMLALDFMFIMVLRKKYFERKLAQVNCGAAESSKSTAQKAVAACIVYAAMVAAVVQFADRDPLRAAALGAIVYTVFDGTLFVMSDAWTAQDALADVAWGATLFFAATLVGSRVAAADLFQ